MEQEEGGSRITQGTEKPLKHIASCSFGKDSMATVILAHLHGEPIDEIVYCEVMFDENTSGEVPEHAQFIKEVAIPKVEKDFGMKVSIIRDPETYISLFHRPVIRGKHKGMLRGSPICNGCWVQRDLKIRPLQKFWKAQGTDTVTYVGIAKDEETRLQRLSDGHKISLLDKYGFVEKDAYNLVRQYGLLSPIYEFAPRNGCFFCPNCKEKEWRHLREHHPEMWQRMIDLENTPGVVQKPYNRQFTLKTMEKDFMLEDMQTSFL